jgi:AraC-like DNA-binding protein
MENSVTTPRQSSPPLNLVRRRHPLDLQLARVFYNPRKAEYVNRAFHSCNFSFVLRGTGRYRVNGQSFPVQAPCVFIQQPGVPCDYGPEDTWEECSLLYAPESRELLARRGYLGDQPIWPITHLPRLQPFLEELIALLCQGTLWEEADRADRLADLVLFESHQQRPAPALSAAQERVRDLLQALEENPAQPGDVPCWARRCALSESSFRRVWSTLCRRSPADHHQHLRLREACRLLIESSLSIAEVGRAVGFDDPLYFSRLFSRKLRVPPSLYRRQQRYIEPDRQS